jgi:excisionase family DNA binding protein
MSKLIGYREAAERIGIAVSTLYNWVSERRIPHRRFTARTVRFDVVDLDAWLAERKVDVSPGRAA